MVYGLGFVFQKQIGFRIDGLGFRIEFLGLGFEC